MQKTRRGFSKTLNIMLQEWDEYSLQIQKLKEKEHMAKVNAHFDKMSKAKPESLYPEGFNGNKNKDVS